MGLHLWSRAPSHALLRVLHLVLRRGVRHKQVWLRSHRLRVLRVLLRMLLWVLLRVLAIWGRRALRRHWGVLLLGPSVVHGGILLELRGRCSVHTVLIVSRGRCNRCRRVRLWGVVGDGGVWSRHLSGGHDIWVLCGFGQFAVGVVRYTRICAQGSLPAEEYALDAVGVL